MNKLLLHPSVIKQLEALTANPPHALGIVGAPGVGKTAAAIYIAEKLLDSPDASKHPYVKVFSPEKGVVTIEQAREIVQFTRLATIGSQQIRRVIIIENAECMTLEAQNAILKVLEEPPADTLIILTLAGTQSVLATIMSRLQLVSMPAPSLAMANDYFSAKGHSTAEINKAYIMSSGAPGLMDAILSSDNEHPLLQSIQQAKSILQSDTFERLMMIDDIIKSKQTNELLYGLQQTAQSALSANAKSKNDAGVVRWQSVVASIYEARELLQRNAQGKLVLTNLLLGI